MRVIRKGYTEWQKNNISHTVWHWVVGIFLLCVFFGCVSFSRAQFKALDGQKKLNLKLSQTPNDTFPPGFLIGTATSAYQIEGAWNIDGKGENVWDKLVHTSPGLIKNNATGDEACDSYHRYNEDIQLIKEIGFNHYRFSISWSRVMPTGYDNFINRAGLDYYHRLIDGLLENGIEPMVTLYHWDLPQPLQEIGGWANPLIADYFAIYARIIFQEFASKVKWWCTINEVKVITQGYAYVNNSRVMPPMIRQEGVANYLALHTMLRAHAKVYRLYEREFKPTYRGKVSIVLDCQFYEPKSDSTEDQAAANTALEFEVDLYTHPIFSLEGDYPESVKERIKQLSKEEGCSFSRLPSFTAEEVKEIRGSFDYFGLNHYTTFLVSPGYSPGILKDARIVKTADPSWPRGAPVWLNVVPRGLRNILNYIKRKYNNPPVFITENGFSSENPKTVLDDHDRIQYHHDYMAEMLKAIHEDECNVIGYTVWSMMDNFEWGSGFSQRFGLYFVNFEDPEKKRTPKLSSRFFKNIIQTNRIPATDKNITDPYHMKAI